jgi:hypothetical protein
MNMGEDQAIEAMSQIELPDLAKRLGIRAYVGKTNAAAVLAAIREGKIPGVGINDLSFRPDWSGVGVAQQELQECREALANSHAMLRKIVTRWDESQTASQVVIGFVGLVEEARGVIGGG